MIEDRDVFLGSSIASGLNIENLSFDQVKSHFLAQNLEVSLQGAEIKQNETSRIRL